MRTWPSTTAQSDMNWPCCPRDVIILNHMCCHPVLCRMQNAFERIWSFRHSYTHGAQFTVIMEGKNAPKIGVWMALYSQQVNSQERAMCVAKSGTNTTDIGVNQQMNYNIPTHFSDGSPFIANTIQTSSKDELAKYYHQTLGSPTTWSMLNRPKNIQKN